MSHIEESRGDNVGISGEFNRDSFAGMDDPVTAEYLRSMDTNRNRYSDDNELGNSRRTLVSSGGAHDTFYSDDSNTGSKKKGGKRRINQRENDGKACCKNPCALF